MELCSVINAPCIDLLYHVLSVQGFYGSLLPGWNMLQFYWYFRVLVVHTQGQFSWSFKLIRGKKCFSTHPNTHTTYRMSDHIVSYWTQFRRDNYWTQFRQDNYWTQFRRDKNYVFHLCQQFVCTFYVLFYFCCIICLIPGPNWKTVLTLSFVTQAKEVLINNK